MPPEARPTAIVLDPVGGISGDMFIAAMLDAFPALAEPVLSAIRASGLPREIGVALEPRRSAGFAAAGLAFSGKAAAPSGTYRDFRDRLAAAPLSPPLRQHALGILRRLAEAEAAVHGIAVEAVHFHEIADWDTLADIVGAAAIIHHLDGARWHCRPLPLGAGMVRTAHGLMPLPAPATAELLRGFSFRADDGIEGERVTPTGAAILSYLDAGEAPAGTGTLVAKGAGAGTRQLPGLPNLLRVLAFAESRPEGAPILIVEFDIDDQTPEEMAIALERLRAVAGVRDVASFAGIGKKGRWLQAVRVMAEPAAREAVLAAVFMETTTLGVRVRQDARVMLEREETATESEAGPVRVKIARRPGGRTAKPEADDIASRANGSRGRARLRRAVTQRALKDTEPTP